MSYQVLEPRDPGTSQFGRGVAAAGATPITISCRPGAVATEEAAVHDRSRPSDRPAAPDPTPTAVAQLQRHRRPRPDGARRAVRPAAVRPGAGAAAAPNALQHVVDLTNAERARAGLPALGIDPRLMDAAQGHSADQAGRDTMTHTGSDGSSAGTRISRQGFTWRSWAENVAMGYPDAPSVMDGWMDSSGHRANVLSASVTHIGVGLAHAADGTPYWTQVFAAPG